MKRKIKQQKKRQKFQICFFAIQREALSLKNIISRKENEFFFSELGGMIFPLLTEEKKVLEIVICFYHKVLIRFKNFPIN